MVEQIGTGWVIWDTEPINFLAGFRMFMDFLKTNLQYIIKEIIDHPDGTRSIHLVSQTEGSFYYVEDRRNREIALEDLESELDDIEDIEDIESYAPKQHPMDRHYPHICFNCKKRLQWMELLNRNIHFKWTKITSHKYKKYKHIKQLWRSKIVQFYCCDCYEMAKVIEEMEEEMRNGKET